MRAWLGDRTDLCVVGDGNQAIYGFAGADPTFLTAFERHFPGATVVQLRTNYRSTPSIVRAAGAVLPADDATPVHAVRGDGGTPTITMYDTDVEEARGVARAVRTARSARRPVVVDRRCSTAPTRSRRRSRRPSRPTRSRSRSAAPPASSTGPR